MKITPNVHNYLMEQTFNIRGSLAKDGRYTVNGRNLGLDFEIHFKTNNHNNKDFV